MKQQTQIFIFIIGLLAIIGSFLPDSPQENYEVQHASLMDVSNIHFISYDDVEICRIPVHEPRPKPVPKPTPTVVEEKPPVPKKDKMAKAKSWLTSYKQAMPRRSRKFLKRFIVVAYLEKEKYDIPISIKMAQAMVESGHGRSKLARETNNYFCIKWAGQKTLGSRGLNVHDDDPDDIFVAYKTAWESFRDHSIFLHRKNYRDLPWKNLHDYEGWAHGLKKAGFATDSRYAHKLINKIEAYGLHYLDEMSGEDLEFIQENL